MTRLLLALFAVVLVQAEFQDEAEYREEMREIDHAFTRLAEYREVPKGAELEREAERLAALFTDVEKFWKARGDEEAAGHARMAKEGAEQASKAIREGNDEAFEIAVDLVAASCESCHEEPLDKYRFRLSE